MKIGIMNYIFRIIETNLRQILHWGKSVLLLGPRQTGKTTLLKQFPVDLTISFANPLVRRRYEQNLNLLYDEIKALSNKQPRVIIDEVQKIPEILDAVQDLIDKGLAQFILTGSSARKLRQPKINWLPGRVINLHLDPLMFSELPLDKLDLTLLLYYGSLPEVVLTEDVDKKTLLLDSYTSLYLEEEIRTEAAVRNVARFTEFLSLAAAESGNIINFSKLSQELGISRKTIADYFQILEDCLIVEKVSAYSTTKTRRRLTKSDKYIFFDLGVKRLAQYAGVDQVRDIQGRLFEELIGIELVRCCRLLKERAKVYYWRDSSGPEVDWLVEQNNQLIAYEVKLKETPAQQDIKHLKIFMSEHPSCKRAYVVCQTPNAFQLDENITAIPWQKLVDTLG